MESNEQMVNLLTNVALQAVREFAMMQRVDVSSVRPDFTTYKGSRSPKEVLAFIAKVDQNLKQKQVKDDVEKINYFVKHLEGDAQIWWSRVSSSMEQESSYHSVIDAFKEAFLDPNHEIDFKRRFKTIRQFSSVADYVRDYRELMSQFPPNYSLEDLFRDFFLIGLKSNVQAQVRATEPINVDRAMTIALEVGSSYTNPYRNSANRFYKPPSTNNTPSQNHLGAEPMDIDGIEASKRYRPPVCFKCGRTGHKRPDCPLKEEGQSN